MKRICIFILCFFLFVSFCGCNESKTDTTRDAVVINLPKDNSVNGYRTENPDYSDKTVISADSVAVDNTDSKYYSSKTENTTTKGNYCLNTNSKIYHKSSCGSVSSMKEENKSYFSDKNEATRNGYKPCQRCNP